MDVIVTGGLLRAFAGLLSAAPTLIIGLFIASILRYYLGPEGTKKLFGGESLRALPQSWLIGMLLPVCSIGVIPILCEMRRQSVRPGALTAFALSAPLFNPLSLLYGLTLSRPIVIVGFAFGSLAVVTILGAIWDRFSSVKTDEAPREYKIYGLKRLYSCMIFMARELAGRTGLLTLIAVLGLFLLGSILPHGALQSEVEQLDPLAPLKMTAVSIFVYATPMLAMSQLGMMFDHGNSPGAAFALLLLGTGVNLATLWWISRSFGLKSVAIWFSVLLVSVLAIAYAVDRPLLPAGIEPAGHTHAFDIYTNPLHSGDGVTLSKVQMNLEKANGMFEWVAGGLLGFIFVVGLGLRLFLNTASMKVMEPEKDDSLDDLPTKGMNRAVSSFTVGLTCLAGLVAFSVVGCYAYYPAPDEVLEEMRFARTDVLSGVSSKDYPRAMRWIPILESWSRRLEVGYAIRNFELRPYQQMQTYILRKKLENLEHAIEHAQEFKEAADAGDGHALLHYKEELKEMDQLRMEITVGANRLRRAFTE